MILSLDRVHWQASHSSPFFMASMEQTRFSSAEYTFLAGTAEALGAEGTALGAVSDGARLNGAVVISFEPALSAAAAVAMPTSRFAVSDFVSPAAPRTSFFVVRVAFSMPEAPMLRR